MDKLSHHFAGVKLNSKEFHLKMQEFAEKTGHAIEDLRVYNGSHKELFEDFNKLKQESFDLNIASIKNLTQTDAAYDDEDLCIITDSSSPRKPLLVLRSVTTENKKRGAPDETESSTHLLPRYLSFKKGDGLDKYPENLLYYLGITMDRFISQDRLFYRESLKDVENPNQKAYNDFLDDYLRPKLEPTLFPNNEKAPDDVIAATNRITRFIADIIFLRISPKNRYSAADIFEEALKDNKQTPTSLEDYFKTKSEPLIFTSPNQILDHILRLSLFSLSSIVNDSHRTQTGQKEPYTAIIDESSQKASSLSTMVLLSTFDPSTADPRHQLSPEETKAFGNMYKEICGDLAKMSGVCTVKDPEQRHESANFQLLSNRISKIGKCLNELSRLEKEAIKIAMPDITEGEGEEQSTTLGSQNMVYIERFFSLARQYVATSERDGELSSKLEHEMGFLKELMGGYAKKLMKIENEESQSPLKQVLEKVVEIFKIFTDMVHLPVDKNEERSKKSESLEQIIGKSINNITEYVPDLAHSKRRNKHFTNKLLDSLESGVQASFR